MTKEIKTTKQSEWAINLPFFKARSSELTRTRSFDKNLDKKDKSYNVNLLKFLFNTLLFFYNFLISK